MWPPAAWLTWSHWRARLFSHGSVPPTPPTPTRWAQGSAWTSGWSRRATSSQPSCAWRGLRCRPARIWAGPRSLRTELPVQHRHGQPLTCRVATCGNCARSCFSTLTLVLRSEVRRNWDKLLKYLNEYKFNFFTLTPAHFKSLKLILLYHLTFFPPFLPSNLLLSLFPYVSLTSLFLFPILFIVLPFSFILRCCLSTCLSFFFLVSSLFSSPFTPYSSVTCFMLCFLLPLFIPPFCLRVAILLHKKPLLSLSQVTESALSPS